jgi:hypothetical protein
MAVGFFSPFDFVGYPVGLGGGVHGHGGNQISHRAVFFMAQEQLNRMRDTEARARQIQRVFNRQAAASFAKAQEQVRRNWAATYTTLLAEV